MNANSDVTATFWTDPDDAPELDQDFFERADEYEGSRLLRRGKPPASPGRARTTTCIDDDIIAGFSASGPGWQTRMNDILRDWLHHHQPH